MKKGKNSLGKNTLIVTIITFISAIVGFLRESLIAFHYGASNISDAFYVASIIPDIIAGWIGYSLTNALIPTLKKEIEMSYESSKDLITAIFNVTFTGLLILTTIAYFFSPTIVDLFAISFNEEEKKITIELLRIMLISIIFSGLSGILGGIYNSLERFFIPASVGIVYNLIFIIIIFFCNKLGYIYLGLAFSTGMFAKFLIQIFPLYTQGILRFKLSIKHPSLKIILITMFPIIISQCIGSINLIVDRSLASSLPEGHISNLNYASKLGLMFFPLIGGTVATTLYPRFASYNIKGKTEDLKLLITEGLSWMCILGSIIGCGYIIYNRDLISLLFYQGAFTIKDVELASQPLIIYGLFSSIFLFLPILMRFYYSRNESKYVMVCSIISIILNIIFSFILINPFGINGLVLANCLSQALFVSFLLSGLKKRLALNFLQTFKEISKNSLPISLCFIIGILIVYFTWHDVYYAEKILILIRGIGSLLLGICLSAMYIMVAKDNKLTNQLKYKIKSKVGD
ncbi:murein biosynthesis integral membrane protein MurJ [Metabacillus litoralis]|uniref:murein biosynthesis integral membrane protein MurJ n=1 Tax=Metabacillus litoralis TaxID=152268 RepID=UPI00203BB69E|nr:murein biosynthesis integral membrane protein MurJ [Metabacillus litoralis]MCM3409927.1 murein biosynthesis integral membrane protein MurJ [Metabacillus litoralis]